MILVTGATGLLGGIIQTNNDNKPTISQAIFPTQIPTPTPTPLVYKEEVIVEENKEFYDLLNELVNEQTFDLELTNDSTVKCKPLTTSQLREIIKATIDSPFTQSAFNETTTKIFVDSLVNKPSLNEINILDKLLFLLETRAQTISPLIQFTNDDDTKTEIDVSLVKQQILQSIKSNKELFQEKAITEGKVTLTLETPSLQTEHEISKYYQDISVNSSDSDELKKFLGEAFINELVKYIKTVAIDDKQIEMNSMSFKERLDIFEKLPAKIVQQLAEYIEKQKTLIDGCLIVNGFYLAIDSTFFTIR